MSFKPKTFTEAKASFKPMGRKRSGFSAESRQRSAEKASQRRILAQNRPVAERDAGMPNVPRKPLSSRARPAQRARRRLKSKPTLWDSVRARLKPEFEARGIVFCEFRYLGCWVDNTLGFAHSRKRDDPLFEMLEVALACSAVCHKKLDEDMSHDEMYAEVMRVINSRGGVITYE